MKRVQLSDTVIVEISDEIYQRVLDQTYYGCASTCLLCIDAIHEEIGGCGRCIIPPFDEHGYQCLSWLDVAGVRMEETEAVKRFIKERTL